MKYCITLENKKYEVEVSKEKAAILKVVTADKIIEERDEKISCTDEGNGCMKNQSFKTIKAPITGVILDIKVSEGQFVNKGDCILILEVMKMENDIVSKYSGVVENIHYKTGDNIIKNQDIIDIRVV